METLNAQEAADYLKVHYMTLLDMVRRKEIPAAKFGRSYVFLKADLEQAIRSRYPSLGSATQVNNDGENHICRYIEGPKVAIGGLMSRSLLEKGCANQLLPRTKKKQANS